MFCFIIMSNEKLSIVYLVVYDSENNNGYNINISEFEFVVNVEDGE